MASVSLRSTLILGLFHLTVASAAYADPTPDPEKAPVGTTGAGSDAPPAEGSGAPTTEDSPKKLADDKAIADKAKLTPIIPNRNDLRKPAFLLYAEIDPPILAVGGVFALARLTKTQPAFCAPSCDVASLNGIDKLTAGYYSAKWSSISDYALYGLGIGTTALLLADEGLLNTLNDGVVIGEATMSATAVASIMTLAAGRPRPFLYSDAAPLSVRNSGDAGLSFLSSHTAEAFAIVTALFVTERRLHPRSIRPKIILGAGVAVASLIGVARVMAGYHFITDVVGGAIVGSSIGILIASVHESPVKLVPVINNNMTTGPGTAPSAGLGLTGSF